MTNKQPDLVSPVHEPDEGIGKSPARKEDQRFLTGQGRYGDDMNLPGQAYAVMVRSPHPHAAIRGIDSARALVMPGVFAVLTGADIVADGIGLIPQSLMIPRKPNVELENSDGSPPIYSSHPVLAADRVRYVGQVVAAVIANTPAAAKDAADLLEIDYEPLPHVTDTPMAYRSTAPRVWDDAPSNVRLDAELGDLRATELAFKEAAHRSHLKTWINRVTACPIEPRVALGSYDSRNHCHVLYTGGGGVMRPRKELAETLKVPEASVRVVAHDVGGNFGTKNGLYPEYVIVVWAAKKLGMPVKWTCERSEALLSDYQGRDLFVEADLALDAQGNFIALRTSNVSNVGAHTCSFVPLAKGAELMSSVYRIPAASVRARASVSNTSSTYPYRSAGRPEAMFVIERLIDIAAQEFGFDKIDLRRRNMVCASEMPFTNPLGLEYDSGDYSGAMDAALRLSDWDGFAKRKEESVRRDRLRGIGFANYVEIAGGDPRERAEVTVLPEGRVDFVIGTLSSGQGHETSFAQLLTEWLGIPLASIRFITGDTEQLAAGGGSHSGRSMRLAGIVVRKASDIVIEKGRQIAALAMEVPASDIEFLRGRYVVKGTDRALSIFETSAMATKMQDLPEDLRGPLKGIGDEVVLPSAFPYGAAVCEVEIDPETGVVRVESYAAVDDVGRAINPMIVHGQTHGAIAQGLGQALLERCHYDSETGQLLSASFSDYALPRADDLPSFIAEISEVPSPNNPLGIRAGGEGGTVPALAALVNAVVDALKELGVMHIEMPVTSESVWRTIQQAKAARR